MATTQLSPMATPGRRYSFVAKTAVLLMAEFIRGSSTITTQVAGDSAITLTIEGDSTIDLEST